jgi:hypothetical protein
MRSGVLFRKTRERWATGRAAFEASQRVGPEVERIIEETRSEFLDLRRQISELPGAPPLCPSCEGHLTMRSFRGRDGWYKAWACDDCRIQRTLSELPRASLADG